MVGMESRASSSAALINIYLKASNSAKKFLLVSQMLDISGIQSFPTKRILGSPEWKHLRCKQVPTHYFIQSSWEKPRD